MKYIRYEYDIYDEKKRYIRGSFTLKEDADKTIVEELKADEVERFEA